MKRLLMSVLLLLALCATCYAQEVSLSISCSIPEIPGVNAPALSAQSTQATLTPAENQLAAMRDSKMQEALAGALPVQSQELIVAVQQIALRPIQTVYSR